MLIQLTVIVVYVSPAFDFDNVFYDSTKANSMRIHANDSIPRDRTPKPSKTCAFRPSADMLIFDCKHAHPHHHTDQLEHALKQLSSAVWWMGGFHVVRLSYKPKIHAAHTATIYSAGTQPITTSRQILYIGIMYHNVAAQQKRFFYRIPSTHFRISRCAFCLVCVCVCALCLFKYSLL